MNRRILLVISGVLALASVAGGQSAGAPAQPGGDPLDMLQSGPTGSLAVRGIQGTKDGPPVGEADVEIHLFHRDTFIRQIDARLDEHGVVVIQGLPVAIGIQPVVRIRYAGVVYQEVGPRMDPSSRDAAIDVTVYQTTDDQPEWRIPMRHLVTEPRADGVVVSETVVIDNPSDRSWLGGPPDSEGRRTAVSVLIPAGVRDVNLDSGFHGWCCTAHQERELAVQMPLMPGRTVLRFSYVVPVADGRAALSVAAPVPVDHMIIFVPEDGSTAEPLAVEAAGTEQMGSTRVRLYQGQSIPGGQDGGVVLTGVRARTPVPPADAPSSIARTIALIGLGLVVLAGVVLIVLRAPWKSRSA